MSYPLDKINPIAFGGRRQKVKKNLTLVPGRVTIGSDPTCDIYVMGTGVASVHCRVENSHGVVTLYPISGSTLLDGLPVEKPTRLSQGL